MAQRTAAKRTSSLHESDTDILLSEDEDNCESDTDLLLSKDEDNRQWNFYFPCKNQKYTVSEVQRIIAEEIDKRIFFSDDISGNESRNELKKFVSFSIFGKEKSKSESVDSVVCSILKESQKLNRSKNQIHCSVIYIFGTDYDSDIFEVPLFKLYINNLFQDPLFIDITGKIYQGWKQFLDADDWFRCLLIAPKDGTYTNSLPDGEIELQYVLKSGNGRDNRDKIIYRNDLQETINKYFLVSEESEGKILDEDFFEITNNLMKKVESGASPNIDLYKKTEVFVEAHYFSKMIEKLGLTWHAGVKNDFKDVNKIDREKARDEAKGELLKLINDREFNKKFKEFWIGYKNLFLLYKNDCKLVYGFKWDDNADFEDLLWEIFKKKFNMEVLYRNNIHTIQFKDRDEKIKIFANDETDYETKVGYMIVPTSLVEKRFDTSQDLAQVADPIPFNGTVRDFMAEARDFQILVASWCEGQYNHRYLEKYDEEILQRFVGICIYGDKARNASTENSTGFTKDELDKINKVVKIIKKKNENFSRFRRDEEKNQIHYGVVQIVGHEYNNEKNSFYKTPLFKVFRNKHDDNPILIDEYGHDFENWDHFYDANYLPKSLICVPKNGCYNLKSKDQMDLDFIRTIDYWSQNGRKLRLALHVAITAGSLFLAFYTGPIAYGVKLGLGTRCMFGATATYHGYSAAKICLHRRVPSIQTDDYVGSIGMVLNVCTDILAPSAASSSLAMIGAAALNASGLGLGIYVLYSVSKRSYDNYKVTGRIDWKDALSVANAALMCGNFALKLQQAGSLIWNRHRPENLPLLKGLQSNNDKITLPYKSISDITNSNFENNSSATLTYVFAAFGYTAHQFSNGFESFEHFKNECRKFGNDVTREILSTLWPMIKEYVEKKFTVKLGEKTEMIFQYGVRKFDLFKIKKWADEKQNLNTMKKKLSKNDINKEKIFNGINATVSKITESLLKKIDKEYENNIEKCMKAEVFVEKAIMKSIIDKYSQLINTKSLNSRQLKSIEPHLLQKAFHEAVKDIENELDDEEFIEKFRNYYNNDKDFIFLANYDSCDYYVFHNKSDINSVVREVRNSAYKMRKQDNIYIITYYNTNQKLILYLDDDDRSNTVGYMVAENLK